MRNHDKAAKQDSSVFPAEYPFPTPEMMWELIISYANGSLGVPEGWPTRRVPAYKHPADYAAHLLTNLVTQGIFESLIPAGIDPIETYGDAIFLEVFRIASKELRREREPFRRALLWIWSEKKDPLATEDKWCKAYLERHGILHHKRHVFIQGILRRGDRGIRRVILLSQDPKHFIDLPCAFLLEQCAGKFVPDELPFRLCARRDCGRFFLPGKSTGKFCSDGCRSRNYWSPEKRRVYMREWRLKKLSPGARRKRLKEMAQKGRSPAT